MQTRQVCLEPAERGLKVNCPAGAREAGLGHAPAAVQVLSPCRARPHVAVRYSFFSRSMARTCSVRTCRI